MSLPTKNNYAIPIATSNNAQLVHCTQINPSHPSKLRYKNMTFCLRIMTFQLPLFWITLYFPHVFLDIWTNKTAFTGFIYIWPMD